MKIFTETGGGHRIAGLYGFIGRGEPGPIHRNFFRSLDMATQAHTAAQISQRYELEMNLGQAENADPTELFSQLMQYADQQRQMGKEENWFAVMGENGSVLYSNYPSGRYLIGPSGMLHPRRNKPSYTLQEQDGSISCWERKCGG